MLSELVFPTSHSADSILMMIGTMRTLTVLELEVLYHFAWPLNSLETVVPPDVNSGSRIKLPMYLIE